MLMMIIVICSPYAFFLSLFFLSYSIYILHPSLYECSLYEEVRRICLDYLYSFLHWFLISPTLSLLHFIHCIHHQSPNSFSNSCSLHIYALGRVVSFVICFFISIRSSSQLDLEDRIFDLFSFLHRHDGMFVFVCIFFHLSLVQATNRSWIDHQKLFTNYRDLLWQYRRSCCFFFVVVKLVYVVDKAVRVWIPWRLLSFPLFIIRKWAIRWNQSMEVDKGWSESWTTENTIL